ncbi:Para-nitrophenol 4-monooxygenase [Talaromyces islandicus]|uniref:Para-nitrophenol 4-monooxygenase n=1 Tax=Talaromyces islandicus TaxID=28573 RepID=A0A0U1M750_TALIS|nr:Para-nitrophenol 4-monooxygenase [Talaromyces islandicus]
MSASNMSENQDSARSRGLLNVVVVGAGPSGILLSILLAKHGIKVDLLEATETLDEQPRAAHYASPAVYELRRAGIIDEVIERGFKPSSGCWRKASGEVIVGMRFDVIPDDPERMVVLPLDSLGKLMYSHLQKLQLVTVKWGHRVVNIGEEGDKAWVEAQSAWGLVRVEGDYVVGADGATSTIRKLLFGPNSFPGETLDAAIVATNVIHDFSQYGYWDTNYLVDPKNWCMVARIGRDDHLYRVSYSEVPGLTAEEYKKRQPARYKEIFPENLEPSQYTITNISPYKLQQRCAPAFRKGRFLLAADAAHVCNPFGGLGLTGGIADIGSLFDCLNGINQNIADDSILDKYAEIRRKLYVDVIDPTSRENFRRLWDQDPDKARENDEFFQTLVKAETDEELAMELTADLNILRHDFTQYYNKI